MANFSRLITTTKGHELIAKILAGEIATEAQSPFTRIVTSSAVYDLSQLEGLEDLDRIHQETLVSATTKINKTTVEIHGGMDNNDLTAGYRLNTVGVFFRFPNDPEEYLYGVTIHQPTPEAPNADFIFPFNGSTTTGLMFDLLTSVGNADKVDTEANPAALVTVKTLALHDANPTAHFAIRNTPNGLVGIDEHMNVGTSANPFNTIHIQEKNQGGIFLSRYIGRTTFSNLVANQKVDLIFPAGFSGTLEVEVGSSWSHLNAIGVVSKRQAFRVATAHNYVEIYSSKFTVADPTTASTFTISDIYLKNGIPVITIANTTNSGNHAWIRISGFIPSSSINDFGSVALSDVYTDDPTIYPPATLYPPPVWHDLVLLNGVTSRDGETPRYCRIGNRVEIQGLIITPSEESVSPFAMLPRGFTPDTTHRDYSSPNSYNALVDKGRNFGISRNGHMGISNGNHAGEFFINTSFIAEL